MRIEAYRSLRIALRWSLLLCFYQPFAFAALRPCHLLLALRERRRERDREKRERESFLAPPFRLLELYCCQVLLHVVMDDGSGAYVSMRQHASACVIMRQHTSACVRSGACQMFWGARKHGINHPLVSVRQRTSACVSIRQHS